MVVSKQFYNHHAKLSMDDKTPPKIHYNLKLHPFFRDYCGAVNGTHINAFVPNDAIARYRNQKGGLTQMCLLHAHLTCGSVMF